ncbi:ATP-dependent DNA helicase PIF1 [Heracleum sosnowskyi]|uniref:ATP-dependent DNA helicase PIF1 n=1 Tax=Heracleum sosnowskyi TaxID=360622 RepID=A0AAD8IRT6_9APIA|nr:ATP-dependent DNA helicase PIF1 [Heracleum sosnowskyi]
MDPPSRKRGRPRVVVTETMAAARREAGRQRVAARRRGAPSETPLRRRNINLRKTAFASANAKHDLGNPGQVCRFCGAYVWKDEFTGRHVGQGPKAYSICCGKGKVQLPLLQATPPELASLLTGTNVRERKFQTNSRMYNTIFALCSFGGNIDVSVNRGPDPHVFRLCDLTYHSMGSLAPPDRCTPKFAQFYMYDGQEAVNHRLNFPRTSGALDPDIVAALLQMLTKVNALVNIFNQFWERFPPSN